MPLTFGCSRPARLTLIAAMVLGTCAAQAQGTADANAAEAQYRLGLYQRETGEPYSAIETLESLLSANPSLNRARLELAVAYYRTLNYARARAEAQRVLDDPRTPENVRLSVLSFVKQMELEQSIAQGKPHKWEINTSAGLLYDSNVNAGPDNAILGSSASGLLTLNSEFLSKSDWGYTAQAGVQHTWQRPEPVRIGESTGRLQWISSINAYQKGYHNYSDFNLGIISLATGPGLIVGQGMRGNLNLQVDHITFGGRELGLYTSLNPTITLRGLGGEITTDVLVSQRSFSRPTDAGRQGQLRSIGLSYGRLIGAQASVQGGVRTFVENTREDRFSNQGHEVFVGGRIQWAGIDFFVRSAVRNARYDGVEPIFNVTRRELERRNEVGASYNFLEGWLEKWQLSATLSNVHNRSNVSLYGYDRDTAFINLGRTF